MLSNVFLGSDNNLSLGVLFPNACHHEPKILCICIFPVYYAHDLTFEDHCDVIG